MVVESHSSRKSTTMARSREFLPEFLYQENTGEWRHRDEDKVNVSLLDDAARSASKTGSQVTCGSGSKMSCRTLLRKFGLPGCGS